MQEINIGYVMLVLIIIVLFLAVFVLYVFQQLRKSQEKVEKVILDYENQLQDIKVKHQREIDKARHQSVEQSRHTIKGQIAEQLAPLLPGFPYLPSDSHFIGDPVDYIVFNGYTEFKEQHNLNEHFELVIIDIKGNKAHLSEGQQRIAEAIKAGKVRFETVRVLDDGTIKTQSWDSSKKKEPVKAVAAISVEVPVKVEVLPTIIETPPLDNISAAYRNWNAFLEKFPNAYEPWNETDENLLKEKYLAGMKINEIALLFKRNPGKIRSHLKEMGVLKIRKSKTSNRHSR